jgi:DNA-3-methyladenine glycosylase
MPLSPLPVSFYEKPVTEVARALLGKRLVRMMDGKRVAGYIHETEAYKGEEDLACHARAGRTPRTAVMYGAPGRAYVYFIYGMHWMFNVVSEPENSPSAVLVRAVIPSEGLEILSERRGGVSPKAWTNGPARLCAAFAIDGSLNGADLTDPDGLLAIEEGHPVAPASVITGPRVGIERVPEPWRSIPWRWQVKTEEAEAWRTLR